LGLSANVLSFFVRHQCRGAGFEKILVKPQPAGDLTWAKGSYNSIRGPIGIDWKKDGQSFTLQVSIPPNTTAEVWVPSTEKGTLTENGKSIDALPG
jgi:alpha-L-rhamnosidase